MHIILLSCSFGIKMTNTFIHPTSSLENHSWFQTKMCKVYTFFRLKWPNNPTLWGSTYLYGFWKGVPSPGFPPFRPFSIAKYYMQALTSSTFRTPTTHIPPAAYTSGLPTPPPPLTSLLLPILLDSLSPPLKSLVLPILLSYLTPNSYPSCCLSFWAP